LQKENIERASGFELCKIVRERFNNLMLNQGLDSKTSEEILCLLEQALRRTPDNNSDEQAWIHRNIGEVYEALGEKLKAIECYEKALNLHPKVGIKRRLDILRKENT